MPTLLINFNHLNKNVDAEVFYNPVIPDAILITPKAEQGELNDSFFVTRANNKWKTTSQSLKKFPITLQNIFNCLNNNLFPEA